MNVSRAMLSGLVLVVVAAGACSPSTVQTPSAPNVAQPSKITTLRLGEDPAHEPTGGLLLGALSGGGGTATAESQLIFYAGLTAFDQGGNLVARLAQKVPSIDDKDWVVHPDGSMQLTWKLRPG